MLQPPDYVASFAVYITLEFFSKSMNIQSRLNDATLLWNCGHREGAFLCLLVAVAATSKLRFGKTVTDRSAFEQFVGSSQPFKLNVEFRGELHAIEHVLYKWLRCELLHAGGLPVDINFVDTPESKSLSVRAGGAPDFVLLLSETWFHHLLSMVLSAPENIKLVRTLTLHSSGALRAR